MLTQNKLRFLIFSLLVLMVASSQAQSILPPVMEWKGKSELLIAKPNNPWITPTEKSGFIITPDYNETMNWLKKISDASPLLSMTSIGKSPEGRDIFMIIASSEKVTTATALKNSAKPLLFVQAGIHSGEIDGKDAGMMLLRDIAFGDKKNLLDAVNFLFIPILNVDGHERSSSYNRPNQRGPQNMGWRTNAENLNLNRDYAKQDTKEVRAVVNVMNEYDPLMYMDIHVTDGADYQYDITFGGHGSQGYSPAIATWLGSKFKPYADKDLKANGHIPGQLLFAVNDRDFSQGNILALGEPRFSDAYGDARHLASVLVENHSLKPFKQRVLGTYVLLESTLKFLATEGQSLKESTKADRAKRAAQIPMKWKVPQMKNAVTFETQSNAQLSKSSSAAPDSLNLLGIESKLVKSSITNSDYVEWTGKPTTTKIVNYKATEGSEWIARPKAYYVPAYCYEVIERLKRHGIQMEILKQAREVGVEMYRISDVKFQNEQGRPAPFEGHIQVTGTTTVETRKETFSTGSAYISTDQPLGDLAMILLEPKSPDSYFSWGFFYQIFQRTEYIEAYVMEPTIKKMLEESPDLKQEFEKKKSEDANFANNPNAIFIWFYSKTKYYDERYLLYPVGRE
ncbi:MAG: M14 family metallopeptidase [Chryseolinea sp.]